MTVEDFQKNLQAGRKLETGDILFHCDAGSWAAVAGQFAQAYDVDALRSCVRQLLFIRPDQVVVVDRLAAVPEQRLPDVQWLLQLPPQAKAEGRIALGTTGRAGSAVSPSCRATPPPSRTRRRSTRRGSPTPTPASRS